jgi:pilus assembly protein FimV
MTSAFPSDLKPNTTTGKSGGGLVDTGNSSFLTDFDKTGPGAIDTDEVDPVAEAEVYIAYGRDAQAEEILKEALARDKSRPEIALKLLEIYHARKSATRSSGRQGIQGAGRRGNPNWQKAAAMGAQIDPQNPLYAGGAGGEVPVAAPVAAPKPDLDFDINTTSAQAAAEPSFDLDLDAQKPSVRRPPRPRTRSTSTSIPHRRPPAPVAHVEPVKEEKPSFRFRPLVPRHAGFFARRRGHQAERRAAVVELRPRGPEPRFAGEGSGEAVGTKLELAKAYLEIGDKDGAREILQEVAKEGSSAQKEEAKKLIASL